jgi:tRNA-dihydrouridine synthase B
MAGITDLPFRTLAHEFGAGLVVSEMVVSRELLHGRKQTKTRAASSEAVRPAAVQLAGREPYWMAEAAKMAEAEGADIIDINMGCPAKKVTSGYSGSALMRDLSLATSIISAVASAVSVPATLKMRTGWDDENKNAPELAKRAEAEGIKMITVHGRTRCQFYTGKADWRFISQVKQSVELPVIANGDINSVEDMAQAMDQSGADGVMIGRAARGKPWLPGQFAKFQETGVLPEAPSGEALKQVVLRHYQELLAHYPGEVGVRVARKHILWYADAFADARDFRSQVCREEDPARVVGAIENYFDPSYDHRGGVAA